MTIQQLFAKKPTDDVIKDILLITKFGSLHNPKEVTKDDLESAEVVKLYNQFKPNLKPFYITCKYKKHVEAEITYKNIITVLRQLVRTRQFKIISKQKYVNGKRIYVYNLLSKMQLSMQSKTLKFNFG
jgi:hypothetical protein